MFSKRRRNYSVFLYTALIISICALLAVLIWPDPIATNESDDKINVNAQTNTVGKPEEKEQIKTENDKEVTEANNKSYYVVKKNNNVISVYFVTSDGTMVKLEDTEILYELLPFEDQNKFEKGIVIEDQEKLATLLQDFES